MAFPENRLVSVLLDVAVRLVLLLYEMKNLDFYLGLCIESFCVLDDRWCDLLVLLWDNLVLVGGERFDLVEGALWVEAWELQADEVHIGNSIGRTGNTTAGDWNHAAFGLGYTGYQFVDFDRELAHFLGHLSSLFLQGLREGGVVLV
jgi:hypothetical protein